MGRVDGERRQHRHDAVHIFAQPGLFPRGQFVGSDHGDAFAAQFLHQVAPAGMLGLHQAADLLMDGVKLFRRGLAVFGRRAHAGPHLALKAGDTDHVELIQVRCRDRQETQPFQQRVVGVIGFLKHPRIEGQPGNFPVDVAFAQLLGAGPALRRPCPAFLGAAVAGAFGVFSGLGRGFQLNIVHGDDLIPLPPGSHRGQRLSYYDNL